MGSNTPRWVIETAIEQHRETIRYGRVAYETTENPDRLLTILSYLEALEDQMRNLQDQLDATGNN